MHRVDSETWNVFVQDAINANIIVEPESGCFNWIGERSHKWGYPLVRIEGKIINVRQWNAHSQNRRVGHVSFFRATCGNDGCVRIPHMELIEIVPVATVRAMEAQIRAEQRA